jgi:probable HAF family extracellular repeat protein
VYGTYPVGVNDRGQIVGIYYDDDNYFSAHGFVYENGNYATLDHPDSPGWTYAFGINNRGQVVGNYSDEAGLTHSFVYYRGPTPRSIIPTRCSAPMPGASTTGAR